MKKRTFEEMDMAGFKHTLMNKAMEQAWAVCRYAEAVYGEEPLANYGDFEGIPLNEAISNVIDHYFLNLWTDPAIQKKAFEVGKNLVDTEMERYLADPVGVREKNKADTRVVMGAAYEDDAVEAEKADFEDEDYAGIYII